ncbi:MAG: hypothetical protein JWP44_1626 [Mucilaginibacter sp.]|nr:hypothetical protein [Mucilaginibacter sp.]
MYFINKNLYQHCLVRRLLFLQGHTPSQIHLNIIGAASESGNRKHALRESLCPYLTIEIFN